MPLEPCEEGMSDVPSRKDGLPRFLFLSPPPASRSEFVSSGARVYFCHCVLIYVYIELAYYYYISYYYIHVSKANSIAQRVRAQECQSYFIITLYVYRVILLLYLL